MSDVFCTDCGNECDLVDAAAVDARLAGSFVWRCPECPESYAPDIPGIGPGEPPSGPETKRARVLLQRDRIDPLLERAIRIEPGRALAQGRIVAWLFGQLGLPVVGAGLGLLTIDQCRDAYRLLRTADYREILRCATQKQPRTPRQGS